MTEPNVLLLDEPTNDLDIEMLTEFEDLLDGWPGTLVVVSHDRYFLERVTDHVDAMLGDGRISALPGGVDDYLERVRARRRPRSRRRTHRRRGPAQPGGPATAESGGGLAPGSAAERAVRKELQRLERQIERTAARKTCWAPNWPRTRRIMKSSPNSAPNCLLCRPKGRPSKSAGSRSRAHSNCDLLLEVLFP